MITDRTKKIYEVYSKLYPLNEWTKKLQSDFVQVMTKFFLEIKTNTNEVDLFDNVVYYSFHNTSLDPPIIYTLIDKEAIGPNALMEEAVFSSSPRRYSLSGQVPFNTNIKDPYFKRDYRWSLKRLERELNAGEPVIVYTDGPIEVRQNSNSSPMPLEQRPFSRIPVEIAYRSGLNIVPIVSSCSEEHIKNLYAWKGLESWEYLIKSRKIDYRVDFLPPINPSRFQTLKEFKEHAREIQIEGYRKAMQRF